MAGRTCAQTSDRKGACVGVGAGEPTSVGTGIGMSSQVADAACVGLGVAVRVNAGEVAGEGVCEVVGNVAGDAAGDAVRDGMGVPQAVPRGEHGGELAADAEQAVERRVFRYARHLERSRLTAAERVLAVSRYQDGIGRLVAFESAFRLRVQAMPGVGMGEWQSA